MEDVKTDCKEKGIGVRGATCKVDGISKLLERTGPGVKPKGWRPAQSGKGLPVNMDRILGKKKPKEQVRELLEKEAIDWEAVKPYLPTILTSLFGAGMGGILSGQGNRMAGMLGGGALGAGLGYAASGNRFDEIRKWWNSATQKATAAPANPAGQTAPAGNPITAEEADRIIAGPAPLFGDNVTNTASTGVMAGSLASPVADLAEAGAKKYLPKATKLVAPVAKVLGKATKFIPGAYAAISAADELAQGIPAGEARDNYNRLIQSGQFTPQEAHALYLQQSRDSRGSKIPDPNLAADIGYGALSAMTMPLNAIGDTIGHAGGIIRGIGSVYHDPNRGSMGTRDMVNRVFSESNENADKLISNASKGGWGSGINSASQVFQNPVTWSHAYGKSVHNLGSALSDLNDSNKSLKAMQDKARAMGIKVNE